jgi:hypothetical protein
MERDEIRSALARSIRARVAAWNKVPAMLESGRLVKRPGGWYRVEDFRVLKELGCITKGLRVNKTGTVAHLQLSKPRQP